MDKELLKRSNGLCELCGSEEQLSAYSIPDSPTTDLSTQVALCNTCLAQVADPELMDANHWRCLNDSMWNQEPAVQVLAWRVLHRLKEHGWPQDLLDMMYLEDQTRTWAEASGDHKDTTNQIAHRDVNGVVLEAGDSVVLIKDLKVKGSSMVAKQGTAVRRISLDRDNPEYIEGKVDGQHIVIITQYVKKI